MPTAAIVVPIYQEKMTPYEAISLRQCFSVLGHYPIVFVCPASLKESQVYRDYHEKSQFLFVDAHHFKSIAAYNAMLLSPWFYKLFVAYQYILIYQLDCFVFSDELQKWIQKGYSYVGAPWFLGNSNDARVDDFAGVGNGGFSLRKVEDCIKVLQSGKKVWQWQRFRQQAKHNRDKMPLARSIKRYFFSHSFKTIHNNPFVNEDKVFCEAGRRLPFFTIPTPQEAIGFAFEMQPHKLYQMNDRQLPFGCHAWWKYDLEFYRPFLNTFGFDVNPNDITQSTS